MTIKAMERIGAAPAPVPGLDSALSACGLIAESHYLCVARIRKHLECGDRPATSRIGGAFHQPRIVQHDGACVAHNFVEGRHGIHFMPSRAQPVNQLTGYAAFQA
jgi:hypothetical protein